MYFPRQPFHASAMLRALADAVESHPIISPSFSSSTTLELVDGSAVEGVSISFNCEVIAEAEEFKAAVAEAYQRHSGKPAPWALEAHPDGKPGLVGGFMACRGWNAGADAELQECDQLMEACGYEGLAAARRPVPPSDREQALAALERISSWLDTADVACIRRALEADD